MRKRPGTGTPLVTLLLAGMLVGSPFVGSASITQPPLIELIEEGSNGASPRDGPTKPNVVVILTDDQRFDSLDAMPTLQNRILEQGIGFTNAFTANPICCPARASILTGLYSHSTGVYHNAPEQRFGGFPAFDDSSTLATWLDGAGYRTGLFGKYLNGFHTTYIPPGWDRWFVTWKNSAYYDYMANDDGTLRHYGVNPQSYGTTVVRNRAVSFIRNTNGRSPLFLLFAPHAPHAPSIPAPGDENAFGTLGVWRPPNYNEPNVTGKPHYIRKMPRLNASWRQKIDDRRLNEYRSLIGVDDAIGEILDALKDTYRLNNTLIMFLSDNGMLWGEHRWYKKVVPYEESIRIPFVIRYDGGIDVPREDGHLVVTIDVAPTLAEVAGVTAPAVEGTSLVPLFSSGDVPWRQDFLIEHQQVQPDEPPTYCAVRTTQHVYVVYETGERELYDLGADPWQLHNRWRWASYAATKASLHQRLKELCKPVPPGFAFHA